MIQGDPETEMLHEIDRARLISFILLELQAQKPIPVDEAYLIRKGFDLKKRPISKTLNMLQNFIDTVTQLSDECVLDKDKDKEEDKDKEKNKSRDFVDSLIDLFSKLYFKSRNMEYISTPKDRKAIGQLLAKYKKANKGVGSEKTTGDFEIFFKACLSIRDIWYSQNMTLPIINSKINEIRSILSRDGTNREVSDEDIARIVGE